MLVLIWEVKRVACYAWAEFFYQGSCLDCFNGSYPLVYTLPMAGLSNVPAIKLSLGKDTKRAVYVLMCIL